MSKKKTTEEATDLQDGTSADFVVTSETPGPEIVESFLPEGDPVTDALGDVEDILSDTETGGDEPEGDDTQQEDQEATAPPRSDTVYRTISTPANAAERLEAAELMVEEMHTLEGLKDRKSASASTFKGMIEECETRIEEHRTTFEQAVKSMKVECEWRIDAKGGRAHLHRIDNGEYVESRDATGDELQGILPLEGESAAEPANVADAIGEVFGDGGDEPFVPYSEPDRGHSDERDEALVEA